MTQNFAERLGWIPKSEDLRMSMGRALNYAQERRHAEVTLEHFLLALVDDPNSGAVFAACKIDLERLRAELTGFIGNELGGLVIGGDGVAQPSEGFKKVMAHASAAAEQSQREYVDGAIVLAALIGEGQSRAAQILNSYGLTFEVAVSSLKNANAAGSGRPPQRPQQPPVEQHQPAPVQQQMQGQQQAPGAFNPPPGGGGNALAPGGRSEGAPVDGSMGQRPQQGATDQFQGQQPPPQQDMNGVGGPGGSAGQWPGEVQSARNPVMPGEGPAGLVNGGLVSPLEQPKTDPESGAPRDDGSLQGEGQPNPNQHDANSSSAFDSGLAGYPDAGTPPHAEDEGKDAEKALENVKDQISGEATVEDILASVREIIGADDEAKSEALKDTTPKEGLQVPADSAFAQGNFPTFDQAPPAQIEPPKSEPLQFEKTETLTSELAKVEEEVSSLPGGSNEDSAFADMEAHVEAGVRGENKPLDKPQPPSSDFPMNRPDHKPEQTKPDMEAAKEASPKKRASADGAGFPPPPMGGMGQQQRGGTPPPPGHDPNASRGMNRDVPPPPAPQQGGFDRSAQPPRPNQQQQFPPGGPGGPNMQAGGRGTPPPPNPHGQHSAGGQHPGHPGGQGPQGFPGQPPMRGRDPQQQPMPGGGVPVQNVGKGQLIENIPRLMRIGIPVRVEVRMARAEVQEVERGLLGNAAPVRHDVMVTEAMTVRLSAPKGGFIIEPNSPETQWIDNRLGAHGENYASWSWTITPVKRGKKPLQLGISARIAGEQGVMAQSALPEQVVSVHVRVNYAQTFKWAAGWLVVAVLGGAVGKYGEHLLEMINLAP